MRQNIKRRTLVIWVITFLVFWKTGAIINQLEKQNFTDKVKNSQSKSEINDSLLANQKLPNSFINKNNSNSFISGYQGIEVHLEGLRWKNKWFTQENDNGIRKIEGRNDFDLNSLVFDPDLPDRGKPDLLVDVSEPEVFRLNEFLHKKLGYKISKVLGEKLSSDKPYESYSWDIKNSDGRIIKKQKMDLWFLKFGVNIRIEPSPDDSRTDQVPDSMIHPVTKTKLSFDAEFDNQRYGNVSLALKFLPKNSFWYFGNPSSKYFVPEKNPDIGIAAVECISLKFEGDPESEDSRIGAHIFKGKSLALHNNLDRFNFNINSSRSEFIKNVEESSQRYYSLAKSDSNLILNSNLFNIPKYSIVHLSNIGAWEKSSFFNIFTPGRKYADQIKAEFLIHIFVLGEWKVKRPDIVDFEAPNQFFMEDESFISKLLPDFGLGILGTIFSGTGLIFVIVFILAIVFSPVLSMINLLLETIGRFIKNKSY